MKIITYKNVQNNQGIGGKAKNLFHLEKLGFNVPKWAVIPENVLLHQISENTEIDELKVEFEKLTIPSEIFDQLKTLFGNDYATKTYAVRSSSMDEDGVKFSYAGQFETFLHVPFDEIELRIKEVWQSSISSRAQNYRKDNELSTNIGIGVIIQEMVDAETSGVAFGADPMTSNLNKKIITSVFGLGEGLVSGELNADTFTIDENDIHKNIARKEHYFTKNIENNGIKIKELALTKTNVASLTDHQIKEIEGVLNTLNHQLKAPQDIEFAYQKNELFLLQTRPITTINQNDKEYILWDNSNIIESYPGITTPLTYTFILKMYEMVYRQFVGIMGVKEKEINQHRSIFANTLGLVRGRVYYNLLNWYKMLAMLPGYSINAENMERMMGVKERFELGDHFKMNKGVARIRIVGMVFRMITMQIKLPKERRKFMAHMNRVMDKYKSIDFNQLSTTEIIRNYKQFEQNILLKWKAPLINDFFAMIWFGLLEKKTKKYCPEEMNLHNDLLCGSQDIISVEPIHKSFEISETIQQDSNAVKLFKENKPEIIWAELEKGTFPQIKHLFDQYILQFGDRCVGELKLETVSYSQKPELFVRIIQSYIQQGIVSKKTTHNTEDDIRKKAEAKINHSLKGKPVKKWGYNFILNQTRKLVSNRENLRYQRTRGFGMVRNMFTALGKRFEREGIFLDFRDVFYLELDEIFALEKEPFTEELKSTIKERKVEFEEYKQQIPPQERFFTYGNVFSDEYIYSLEKIETTLEDLSGIGCCPGIVKGKVRIVTDPNEIGSLNGDILVTSSTDPGWVTLFPTASAIIVERGSLLSHSAIVSREMGIPCIVSVDGLLRTLKTGDLILMNGSTGEIKRIEDE